MPWESNRNRTPSPVTVTWAAVGDVTIGSEPAVADIGPKAPSGSQRFVVERDTRFTLTASRFLSCKRTEADVVILFPDLSQAGDVAYQRFGPPRDAMIRMFYVGMTRAREALYLPDRAGIMAAHLAL